MTAVSGAPVPGSGPGRWNGGRAAIYVRVSTDEQSLGSGLTVQKEVCLRYCAEHRMRHVTFEEAMSGASLDRPVLDRMMQDAAGHRFSHVVVYRLDRLARSSLDLQSIHRYLADLGIGIVSVTEPFDTGNLNGKLMFDMAGAIAEWERGIIQERTTSGMRKRASAGHWKGGPVAFGYRYTPKQNRADPGRLEPDPEQVKVILQVYRRFLECKNINQVARELNVADHRTGGGKCFSHAHIRHILMKPLYRGVVRYNDITVYRPELRIVSDELFDRVQAVIAALPKGRRPRRKPVRRTEACHRCSVPLLGTEQYCPHCGVAVTRFPELCIGA